MEDYLVIIGFFLFYLLMAKSKKNRRQGGAAPELPERQERGGISFEIPHLEGAPAEDAQRERRTKASKSNRRREAAQRQTESAAYEARGKQKEEKPVPDAVLPDLSPEAMRNAVIYAEVLGRSKALRGRPLGLR